MHDLDFDHDHLTDDDKAEIARFIWAQETVELNTVGIDIGSSTSHLLFAKVDAATAVTGVVVALCRNRPRGGLALADHADAVPG